MRSILVITTFAATPAFADPGHIEFAGGHSHLAEFAAIFVVGAIAWALIRAYRRRG